MKALLLILFAAAAGSVHLDDLRFRRLNYIFGEQSGSSRAESGESDQISTSMGIVEDTNSETTVFMNLTVPVGNSAYLRCRVHNANEVVIWFRRRDSRLLTIDRYVDTPDDRFRINFNELTGESLLELQYAQIEDSGLYECRGRTRLPTLCLVSLTVVDPEVTITGEPEVHIVEGHTIKLICTIKYTSEPPHTIHWLRNSTVISVMDRPGMSIISQRGGDETISQLMIHDAHDSDSGEYTCQPSNANYKTVFVTILHDNPVSGVNGMVSYLLGAFTVFCFILTLITS